NTGVDNIRELRETVALPPTSLKYKVYIIDEVHMLSTGAFNALLKTLEEPPSHVIFILATTEIHKVPETILSRVARFDFTRLPIENIIEKLSLIAKAEKVKIEKEALEMIAIAAEGGMRDAESLLGQIISLEDKNITAKEVEDILGTADRKIYSEIAAEIIENNSTGAISKINNLQNDGYDLAVFNKSLINYFRQMMLLKINDKLADYFKSELTKEQLEKMKDLSEKADLAKIIVTINLLLEAQNKIASFILPQLPLEIAIIRATQTLPSTIAALVRPEQNQKPQLKTEELEEKIEKELPKPADKKPTDKNNIGLDLLTVQSKWSKLLNDIQPYNHSLKALLLNCQATHVDGNEITIATPYDFYKERLNENSNRLTVEEVFGKILGCNVRLIIVVDKNLNVKKEEKISHQDPLLASAMEIMGGKIVEE
ncbi:MAG TPA: DNA polymerase III subunit gamma/tau, partial [Patescibacteria group bacterium]|nr:DNA polymerase III subunit gamma/tau [Patescibacteria group bacterium]